MNICAENSGVLKIRWKENNVDTKLQKIKKKLIWVYLFCRANALFFSYYNVYSHLYENKVINYVYLLKLNIII